MRSATEESVGITEYNNDFAGMNGIIKHRYSDFHVHEIDQDGKIIYLTSLEKLEPVPFPEGFEEWVSKSGYPFFKFTPENKYQLSQIYFKHPELKISIENKVVTLEKQTRRRPRPMVISMVICKENTNQQESISKLSKKLNIKKNQIGIAGNKDKRAITTQVMTIRDVGINSLEQLANLTDKIKCGMFYQAMNPVNLGDLNGNHFTLVLRNLTIPGCETVEELREGLKIRMEALSEKGFINYFGMQRFGTTAMSTHTIGIAILRKEWQKVIDMIMSPIEGNQEDVNKAKTIYMKTHDAEKAYALMPKHAATEKSILAAAKKGIKNPFELFKVIDRRQRLLYCHAYQSYVWNHCASARVKRSGFKVVPGDIVEENRNYVTVKAGNESKYSPFDIVIPLPADGCISPDAEELLKKDGIEQSMFSAQKELGLVGDYRKLFAQPTDISFDIIEHDDNDAELIDSDIDKLEGRTNKGNHVPGGKFKSAVVEFSLGPSQYATMCMRELMKRTTEWWNDSDMSNKSESGCSSWHCRIC
ncbi:hypothetical protein TVAG_050450 [Trichomonas vaginalis G3]|uniref:TRUD domain-containing protein n=1 Tax=Trichomonas vaginalis (strain ATCC PRA-98 / G3) TaxID=412133 RepID=A2EJH2_TRIV3|nr:pseudouridylate synthase 7-like protein family [Trichomonas vaginalis G3]EAY07229.1 hypothetical protein TVAG_050450 [Trichomonas vaginalis G3]KAI5533917.1 pseudouridylate synthase 7-like protein family [Trichomonas vaginalis G3]|eukprot:XP_001319452.1 hypothetical protein [Trichomonas vaginalis G3]